MAYAPPAGFAEYIQDYLPGQPSSLGRVSRPINPSRAASLRLIGSVGCEREREDDVEAYLNYREEQVRASFSLGVLASEGSAACWESALPPTALHLVPDQPSGATHTGRVGCRARC